jgi:hypothetical protein
MRGHSALCRPLSIVLANEAEGISIYQCRYLIWVSRGVNDPEVFDSVVTIPLDLLQRSDYI